MGKPKFSRKKYVTPSHPWQEDRIKAENELIRKYGLKNKREIWKAETKLRKFRGQARELLAKAGGDAQSKKESDQLLMSLNRLNILPQNSTLDDVLALETESVLSRRLQTLTYLKGLANTPFQARQLISHGHIAISNRRVTVPGYIVTKEEEGEISYIVDSPLNDVMHPARPRADFKSVPFKREVKPEEKKKEVKEEKPKEGEEPIKEPPKEETPQPETLKKEAPAEEPPKQEIPESEQKIDKPIEEPPKTEVPEPPKEEKPSEEPPKEEHKEEPTISEEKPKEPGEPPIGEKPDEKKETKKKEDEDKEGGDN